MDVHELGCNLNFPLDKFLVTIHKGAPCRICFHAYGKYQQRGHIGEVWLEAEIYLGANRSLTVDKYLLRDWDFLSFPSPHSRMHPFDCTPKNYVHSQLRFKFTVTRATKIDHGLNINQSHSMRKSKKLNNSELNFERCTISILPPLRS